MRPRDVGTKGESAVVRHLQAHGWPHAERRQLRGRLDAGDITGCPGLCFEIKAGDAARAASDALVVRWLAETETERVNAGADIGILVVARLRQPVGRWWAVIPMWAVVRLGGHPYGIPTSTSIIPARFHLADLCRLLLDDGYGDVPPGARPAAVPTVDDLAGIAPGYTGDLSSDEYLRSVRGGAP